MILQTRNLIRSYLQICSDRKMQSDIMKLEGLYTIQNIEARPEGFAAQVIIHSGHHVYDGHFPGQPVVPGVCILNIVRDLISEFSGCEQMFSNIKECKFVSALIPVNDLYVSIEVRLQGEGSVWATVCESDRTVMKLSASLTLRNGRD